ncbi:MAG: extracellular solute-binding protein [bacterium]
MKKFQIIVIVIFIVLAIFGVLVFSGTIPIGKNSSSTPGALGNVVLWGFVKSSVLSTPIDAFNAANTSFVLKYVEKSPDTFDHDLLEALADGNGPDLILVPENLAFHYSARIFPIPYESYPLASYQSNFASAGNVFATSKGILAFPLSIDPLMMYFNRSTLDANGIVYPPASWDDLVSITPTLTKKDDANKITKSAVGLGHFVNVDNAKAILSTLLMQAGSPLVSEQNGGVFKSKFDTSNPDLSSSDILNFYTSFTDPNKAVYTWNRSLPGSGNFFSSENSAFYFGFASELSSLINRNPNQNFGVAAVPQIKNASSKSTYSHVFGVALLSSSRNSNTAFTAASLLASGDFAAQFANATGTVPARRDLLNTKKTDAFSNIFYTSALFAKSWLDPASSGTDKIFSGMIEGAISNSVTSASALSDASSKLDFLLLR